MGVRHRRPVVEVESWPLWRARMRLIRARLAGRRDRRPELGAVRCRGWELPYSQLGAVRRVDPDEVVTVDADGGVTRQHPR